VRVTGRVIVQSLRRRGHHGNLRRHQFLAEKIAEFQPMNTKFVWSTLENKLLANQLCLEKVP
jgi:hypothetical protein